MATNALDFRNMFLPVRRLELDVVPLFVFVFVAFDLVSNPKMHHQDPCQRAYCLRFVVGIVWLQVLRSSV